MYVRIVSDKRPKGFETPSALQGQLESVLERHAKRTIDKLKIYPTKLSPSGYRRTGRIRDEWRYFRSRAGGEIAFRLQNDARDYSKRNSNLYASYVQGNKQQDVMKAIGWKTADELLDREAVARDVQSVITDFLRGR